MSAFNLAAVVVVALALLGIRALYKWGKYMAGEVVSNLTNVAQAKAQHRLLNDLVNALTGRRFWISETDQMLIKGQIGEGSDSVLPFEQRLELLVERIVETTERQVST